ncbi:hypothetical protein AX14_014139 [Amanita brunnescens Koide BX004]|nr:hypothetical protein AX14_014139 [Amanita brunnescens Koide BX004]
MSDSVSQQLLGVAELFTHSLRSYSTIYLVKKRVDYPLLRVFGATHWAIRVDDTYYHLNQHKKKIYLDPNPPTNILSEEAVGKTSRTHRFIKEQAEWAAQTMNTDLGGYNIFGNNCQDFANLIFIGIDKDISPDGLVRPQGSTPRKNKNLFGKTITSYD